MTHEAEGVVVELRNWCVEHPSFEVAETNSIDAVLLRLAPPAHAEDIADEVYVLVETDVDTPEGVTLEHVVVDDLPALEVTVTDHSLGHEVLRSVIEQIGADAERLIALWHPELPEDGA